MRYRQKPTIVEAFQWTKSTEGWPSWLDEALQSGTLIIRRDGIAQIRVHGGYVFCDVGVWIVKGAGGQLSICPAALFKATYEPVED